MGDKYIICLEAVNGPYWKGLAVPQEASGNQVRLCEEKNYPAELIYTRTDINGSTCYESAICKDREDLLSWLDWVGSCGFVPELLWDFNIDKSQDDRLIQIISYAYHDRMAKLRAEGFEMFTEDELDEKLSLDAQIDAARAKSEDIDDDLSKFFGLPEPQR